MDRLIRTLWAVAVVLVAAGVAWLAAERWTQYEIATARRALDVRAGELAQRTLTPGSPLACLDAVANATVEAACEKALFANPETIAAAIAYADAKLAVLADGLAHAALDPAYGVNLDRLRRGLEADRFGVVAQALASRGCTAEACPALKLFRDPKRVAANLTERTFDANVVLHAAAWRDNPAVAAAPGSPTTYAVTSAATSPVPAAGLTPGAPIPGKYEFPSAASIPPVSIMDAEPPPKAEDTATAPPAPQAAVPAVPAPPPAKKQPARRQLPTQNVPLPPPAPIMPGAAAR